MQWHSEPQLDQTSAPDKAEGEALELRSAYFFHLGFYGRKCSLLNQWEASTMPHIVCVLLEGAFLLALVSFQRLLCSVDGVSLLTRILAKQKLKPSLKLSLKRH